MAQFFSFIGCFNNEIELKEFICRRFNNVDYILAMDVNEFIPFLIKAREVETDEHLRAQWISMLPLMSTKQLKYISFEDYRDQCLGRNIDKRSTDEIIAELEKIHGHKLL